MQASLNCAEKSFTEVELLERKWSNLFFCWKMIVCSHQSNLHHFRRFNWSMTKIIRWSKPPNEKAGVKMLRMTKSSGSSSSWTLTGFWSPPHYYTNSCVHDWSEQNPAATHRLTNPLSADSYHLMTWVKSGVLLRWWTRNLQPHNHLCNSLDIPVLRDSGTWVVPKIYFNTLMCFEAGYIITCSSSLVLGDLGVRETQTGIQSKDVQTLIQIVAIWGLCWFTFSFPIWNLCRKLHF